MRSRLSINPRFRRDLIGASIGLAMMTAGTLGLLLAPPGARGAPIQLDQPGCVAYGTWSADIIWARDVGADREKVRASLAEMRDEGGAMADLFALLLRDLDALWATAAAREAVLMLTVRECYARGGRYELGEGT